MKVKNKKITMDDLAGMVQRGFSSVDKKFLGVNKRFDLIDARFDKVESRLGNVEKDVAELKENFHKILDSLDKVTKQYSDYLEERKLRDVEMARMKKWIEQIAQKIGVNLEP